MNFKQGPSFSGLLFFVRFTTFEYQERAVLNYFNI